jgi:outer membrane protein
VSVRSNRAAMLFALFAVSGSATAQTTQPQAAPPGPLTLADAVARALAGSYPLREMEARRTQAEAGLELARSATRPRASVDLGYQRTNHVDEFGVVQPGGAFEIIYPDVPENYSSRVGARWPIYDGGRSTAARGAAAADVRAAASDEAALRSDLRLQVVTAYWNVLTTRQNVQVLERSLARLDVQRGDVKARLDAGFIPPSDLMNVDAQRASQRALLIEVQSRRDTDELTLRELVFWPADAPLELAEPLEPPAPAVDPLERLTREAAAARAERAALVARVESASRRVEGARAGLRPSLTFAGGYDYARPNPRIFPRVAEWNSSWDAGAFVNWPFYDGGRTRAETAQAQAAEQAARARLAEFDRQLRVEVGQRRLEQHAAVAAIAAADEGVKAAAEAQRVLRERYKVGVATNTEVLDAEVALLTAELTRTRALVGAELAQARLDRAVGR